MPNYTDMDSLKKKSVTNPNNGLQSPSDNNPIVIGRPQSIGTPDTRGFDISGITNKAKGLGTEIGSAFDSVFKNVAVGFNAGGKQYGAAYGHKKLPPAFDWKHPISTGAPILGQKIGKAAKGFLHSLIGPYNSTYLRDSRHSRYDFGQNGEYFLRNVPRQKFNYFIKIDLDTNIRVMGPDSPPIVRKFFTSAEELLLIPLAKSVSLPGVNITTETLNEYNKKTIINTGIKFTPITLEFHDVVDGKTLRFWELYYETYFKNGRNISLQGPPTYPKQKTPKSRGAIDMGKDILFGGSDIVKSTVKSEIPSFMPGKDLTNNRINSIITGEITRLHKLSGLGEPIQSMFPNGDGFYSNIKHYGMNLDTTLTVNWTENLIRSISIYMVNSSAYSKVIMINPKITSFAHDTLSYESKSDLVKMTMTFEYENLLYDNCQRNISQDDLISIYGNANNLEYPIAKARDQDISFGSTRQIEKDIIQESTIDTSLLGTIGKAVGDILLELPGIIGDEVSSAITGKKRKGKKRLSNAKDTLVRRGKSSLAPGISRAFGSAFK